MKSIPLHKLKGMYFSELHDPEVCYDIDTQIDMLYSEEREDEDIEVVKGVKEPGYFYCKEFNEVGEVGSGCGRNCSKYKPMNGRSGKCAHSGSVYSPDGEKYIMRLSEGKLTITKK